MNHEQQKEYEEMVGSPEMERLNYLMEHPEEQVESHNLSNVKNVPKQEIEVSKVNWEEKMVEPDMFVIKKTQDNGGYVCYNHGRLKYTQVFAHNPQDALQRYMEKLIELIPLSQ